MTTNHDFLDNLANHQHQKMLREIANDDQTPKKTDSLKETEILEENVIPSIAQYLPFSFQKCKFSIQNKEFGKNFIDLQN